MKRREAIKALAAGAIGSSLPILAHAVDLIQRKPKIGKKPGSDSPSKLELYQQAIDRHSGPLMELFLKNLRETYPTCMAAEHATRLRNFMFDSALDADDHESYRAACDREHKLIEDDYACKIVDWKDSFDSVDSIYVALCIEDGFISDPIEFIEPWIDCLADWISNKCKRVAFFPTPDPNELPCRPILSRVLRAGGASLVFSFSSDEKQYGDRLDILAQIAVVEPWPEAANEPV